MARISPVSPTWLESLSEASKECILRLSVYKPETFDLSQQPRSRLAAVLVLLYEQAGELRVLLTTRSKLLRAHPGQTALPGGKVDEKDGDFVATAYREAYEEVGLPLNSPDVHTICTLEPFFASSGLLVTPVVGLLTDNVILTQLRGSPDEVTCIFNHPLQALLEPKLVSNEELVVSGSENWHYESEYHSTTDMEIPSLGMATYRMHRFRSTASPIKGLTSDVLIKVAEIAYAKGTAYERYAPGQVHEFPAICGLLEENIPQRTIANGQAIAAQ